MPDQVQMAAAQFTGNFRFHVFCRDPQFFLTVRASRVKGDEMKTLIRQIQKERFATDLALNVLREIFAIDAKFLTAFGTVDVQSGRLGFDHRGDLP